MGTYPRLLAVVLLAFATALTPGGAPVSAAGRQGGGTQAPPAQNPPAQNPPAQTPPAGQQPPPVFRAGVNFVRVDVIVTDKQGNAVTDLTAEEVEIVEDGKAQTIDLFKIVNADGNPAPGAEPARPIRSRYDEESEAARDDVRLFVIFLDDYHVRLGNSMRVRDPLARFVQTQLGPLDMVAIMYPLMSVNDLTFTRNHDAILSAVRRFEGRKYDYRPRNAIEEKYVYYPAQAVETIRNQVTITALEGLAVRLGSMREGRKAVLLVSEGFTSLLPPQLRDPIAAMPGAYNPAARNPTVGDNPTEDRARFLSEIDLQSLLREVYDAANRNNTAFYALDPRGLAVGEFDINENVNYRVDSESLRQSQGTLRTLAEETDGRAIVNQNDLDRGLRQLIRDTSTYYLVGYNSTARSDGKFHKIDVRVKRPGTQVRSRKGYWAATASEAAAAAAPPKPRPPAEVERALGAMEGRPRDAVMASWYRMSPGDDGMTRVTFVWEPIPAPVGVVRQEPVALQFSAVSASGESAFRGRVPEAEPAPAPDAAAPPAPPAAGAGPARPAPVKASRIAFDVKPGRMRVNITVENARGQVIDTVSQDVVVPDLTTAAVRVTAPAILRARTAREYQALSRDADPVPTALREFRRTDRLIFRFEASGQGTALPQVTVRLLNRVGTKMADLAVKPPTETTPYYEVDLPLAGFAAGDYLVEVAAASGEARAAELVAMKITS